MVKQVLLLILPVLLSRYASAQDFGYRTTDIGAGYQYYPHGSVYTLHASFNAKLNHSFQLKFGFNQLSPHKTHNHLENGEGWGGGIGYRYYFTPVTKRFYAGINADIWVMKILIDYSPAGGPALFPKNAACIEPSVETGYTFLINEAVFITPYAAAGFQATSQTTATDQQYGKGFFPAVGIRAGIRF